MRSLLLILTTCAILLGGFGLYWWNQRASTPRIVTPTAPAPVKPPQRSPGGGIGQVQGGWIKYFDKTGRLLSRLRASHYDPITEDRVAVRDAEVDHFLRDGQVVKITGKTGTIVVQQAGGHAADLGGNFAPSPSRGLLRDVTVTLLPPGGGAASLVLTMNNASFDNESLLIRTEDFKDPITRTLVPRDRVPVSGRGEDYDFDGQGLEIRWNDKDHRLEFLKVFHGQRLVIKKPGKFMADMGQDAASAGPQAHPMQAAGAAPVLGGDSQIRHAPTVRPALLPPPAPARFAADVRPAPPRAAKKPKPVRPPPPAEEKQEEPVYRAEFHQQVRILQEGQFDAHGDLLRLDFRQRQQGGDSPATRPAADDRPDQPPAPRRAASRPASRPASRVARTSGPAVAISTTQATSQPAEQPVIITWVGPLTMQPLPHAPADRIEPGQAHVQLSGQNVTIVRPDSTTTCGLLAFKTAQRWMQMQQGPAGPVVMKDIGGAVLTTPRLDFSRQDQIAHLYGRSSARLPAGGTEGAPSELLANWSEQCTLYFAPGAGNSLDIRRAELRGDVDVNHPQLLLRAKRLALGFEPASRPAQAPATPTTTGVQRNIRANLRELDATEDVHCKLMEAGKTTQTIDCNHLKLLTEKTVEQQVYARQVIADGDVYATEPRQDLRCGYLSMLLQPATRPATRSTTAPAQMAATELESLKAQDNVRVITKDTATGQPNGSAQADDLVITRGASGQQRIGLRGAPAVVVQGTSTLRGPHIQFHPDTQQAAVLGAGTLNAQQQDAPSAPPQPIEVKWQTALNVDGLANRADVLGGVVSNILQTDGTLQTARSERMRLLLADAPTTAPTSAPSSRPASRPSQDLGPMANKTIRQVHFLDSAVLNSTLTDAKGKLLRSMQLESQQIEYDLPSRRLLVPMAGKMGMEDHRPPAAATSQPTGDMRGVTWFVWDKQLDYNPQQRIALLEGNVRVAHADEKDPSQQTHLTADSFTADLEPVPTNAATRPGAPEVRLRRARGNGNVVFKRSTDHLEAESAELDPTARLLALRGTERNPVKRLATEGPFKGMVSGTFREALVNIDTWQIKEAGQISGRVLSPPRPATQP